MPATEVPHKLGRWPEISAGLGLAVDRDITQIYYAVGQCDAERIALCSLSERGVKDVLTAIGASRAQQVRQQMM